MSKTLYVKIIKLPGIGLFNIYSHALILNDEYFFAIYNKNSNYKCIDDNKRIFSILRSKKYAILNIKNNELYIRKFACYRLLFDSIKIHRLQNEFIDFKTLKHIKLYETIED